MIKFPLWVGFIVLVALSYQESAKSFLLQITHSASLNVILKPSMNLSIRGILYIRPHEL